MDKDTNYKLLERRQKAYIKAYAVLCLVLLISAGLYCYKAWNEYSGVRSAVDINETYISKLKNDSTAKQSEYLSKKSEFQQIESEVSDGLSVIFPLMEEYTALTRQIDSMEEQLNTLKDPFSVSNIDYANPIINPDHSILPVRMNITSSQHNFTKFLHLVETSGSLANQTRLMDVNSIRLRFQDEGETDKGSKTIVFTVQLNAYFQTPKK